MYYIFLKLSKPKLIIKQYNHFLNNFLINFKIGLPIFINEKNKSYNLILFIID